MEQVTNGATKAEAAHCLSVAAVLSSPDCPMPAPQTRRA